MPPTPIPLPRKGEGRRFCLQGQTGPATTMAGMITPLPPAWGRERVRGGTSFAKQSIGKAIIPPASIRQGKNHASGQCSWHCVHVPRLLRA